MIQNTSEDQLSEYELSQIVYYLKNNLFVEKTTVTLDEIKQVILPFNNI